MQARELAGGGAMTPDQYIRREKAAEEDGAERERSLIIAYLRRRALENGLELGAFHWLAAAGEIEECNHRRHGERNKELSQIVKYLRELELGDVAAAIERGEHTK